MDKISTLLSSTFSAIGIPWGLKKGKTPKHYMIHTIRPGTGFPLQGKLPKGEG